MSYPCVNLNQFVVDGSGALSPQPYMQWRHVATNSAGSIQKTYIVAGGAQAEDLVTFQVAWTNPNPISMQVYAVLTRAGSSVQTGARTRAFIATYFGQASGASPADPAASTLIGRTGSGVDGGTTTVSSTTYALWATTEVRQAGHSMLIGPTFTLAPTQTLKTSVRLRWDADFWETLAYNIAGSGEATLAMSTGASRLDLYAIPVIP